MIANALVQIEPHRETERRGQIDARRLFQGACRELVNATHGTDYSGGMKRSLLILALALAACSTVTEENYRKIQDGMTEEQVDAILGRPSESNSMNVLGVAGTVSKWTASDAVITVRFVNGKVALRSYDRPATK